MAGGNLTPLQWRSLEILGGLEPPWTLTGGGALVGFHLQHRVTLSRPNRRFLAGAPYEE
jgi:hypothetical protein